ncbi:MAG: type IV secretion system DNA-binding domain-containing protein [Nitrososphaerota archaeon]|nr:type IV secretion system DNA-binding domain-containing protein [Nitrososphaerota archaeon]
MGQTLDSDDTKFHMLVTGGTGSGKTNAVLHMLKLLFSKKEEGKPHFLESGVRARRGDLLKLAML